MSLSTGISALHEPLSKSRAILPGGPSVMALLKWDPYKHFWGSASHTTYNWQIGVSVVSHDDALVRVRQTIDLCSRVASYLKHDSSLAFDFRDLVSAQVIDYTGRWDEKLSPGNLKHYREHPPVGVHLRFRQPIRITRWSCVPLSMNPISHEMSLYEIPLWLDQTATAERVAQTFSQLRDRTKTQPSSGDAPSGEDPLPPTRSEETGTTSLGGVSRL